MKPGIFFDKFEQLANTPDASVKIRELVLRLAVTGKLLARHGRDVPASVLLEATAAERALLVAGKKVKPRPSRPVEYEEQPFDLPAGWAWARLSDVGYELGQKVPDGRFTYIDVGAIDSVKGCISNRVEELEPGEAPSRARKLVVPGTVIYSTVRPYLLNIAIVEQSFDPEPIASTAFGVLHPFKGINSRYLFYWLRSAPFTSYVQAAMKGMAYPAINDEAFYSGPIALPPTAEQQRIVNKVDQLMALCDRLEAQQEERDTKLAGLARASLARFAELPSVENLHFLFHPSYEIPPEDLRHAILTLAIKGKLLPQDPDEGTAEQVRSAKQAKFQARGTGEGAWLSEGDFDDPFGIPDNWSWIAIGDVVDMYNGRAFKSSEWSKTGLPIVRIQNLNNESAAYNYFDGEYDPRHKVTTGSFLISWSGTPGTSFGAFIWSRGEALLNQHIFKCEFFGSAIEPRYLALGINARLDQMISRAQGGVGLRHITKRKLEAIRIPLPPLAEQRRIVARVDELMALLGTLGTQLAASHAIGVSLLESVVAELAEGA